MASTTDDRHGARGASDQQTDIPHAIRNLPARLGDGGDAFADNPPENPDAAYERVALRLWEAGRKEEAVEFLSREVARRNSAALRGWPTILDVTPQPAPPGSRGPALRRPLYLGAAAALSALLLWFGADRIIALSAGASDDQVAAIEMEPGNAEVLAAAEPSVEASGLARLAEEHAARIAAGDGAPATIIEEPVQTGSINRTGETAEQDVAMLAPPAPKPRPAYTPRAAPEPPLTFGRNDPRFGNEGGLSNEDAKRIRLLWEGVQRQLAIRRAQDEQEVAVQRYQEWMRSNRAQYNERRYYRERPRTYYYYDRRPRY